MVAVGGKKVNASLKGEEDHAGRSVVKSVPRSRDTETKRRDALREEAFEPPRRKRTRALALSNEHEFVNAILETTEAIIVVLDTAGRIVRFNKASERSSGRRSNEVFGAVIWELLVPAEEREGMIRVFEELRSGCPPNSYENHWWRLDGSRRLISWSNISLFGGAGDVQYVVATGIDVTEQRQAERELSIRQRELIRVRRLYTVGALTALLAHELNQPLGAIVAFGEASLGQLQGDECDERLKRNLTQIVEQAQRASRVIREVGRFVARDKSEGTPTELSTALGSACNLVSALARARGVRLTCAIDEQRLRVTMPALELEHILLNLLQNAIDALRDAGTVGGSISVRICYQTGDDRVQIGVEDTGPGISAELTDKVFGPLYTTKMDGLGLGLSICRSIVEGYGGKLWAEAKPGGKFYLQLPIAP